MVVFTISVLDWKNDGGKFVPKSPKFFSTTILKIRKSQKKTSVMKV